MNRFVELLAPAGSPESFYGAISAGADAVYLAGTQYGARAYADNFPEEELLKALCYAHLFHKKVYMTVNTLTKEQELEALPAFLKPYVEEGLDGVIVQDFGVLSRLGEVFPKLPLHASTQMSITGAYGVNLLKELGVTRVVPARELCLSEVKKLKEESGLEIECFIHGAMCYCYSGQCLFSSMLGGRSGNRGRCAQPCRLPYRVSIGGKTTKEAY
ncbi:MAG: U32 family peptidase, partial [Lachnospiraceae bacterium]|nr:U32 family peptidase [Lachnospiraceae bacterium]